MRTRTKSLKKSEDSIRHALLAQEENRKLEMEKAAMRLPGEYEGGICLESKFFVILDFDWESWQWKPEMGSTVRCHREGGSRPRYNRGEEQSELGWQEGSDGGRRDRRRTRGEERKGGY